MTWLTWRQQRLEALIGSVVLGLVGIALLWTGHTMIASYDHGGSAACVASHSSSDSCWTITGAFGDRFSYLDSFAPWMNFLPLFIGLLLASPVILELEQGTHRLVWTQSITRARWLATKLGWIVGTAIGVALGLALLWTWWRGPFDHLQGRLAADAFDFEGIVPIAYTLFALALCLAIGVLLRRTAPAIALAFAGFLALRLPIESKLRPHFLAPEKIVWDPTGPTPAAALTRLGSGDWVLSEDSVFRAGATATSPDQVMQACQVAGPDKQAFNTCLHAHGLMNSIVYQPASRFWIFQGIESAIFLGIAAALLALTVWWALRHIA